MTKSYTDATYVYGLTRGPRPPSGLPDGLPGAGPTRALDAGGGLWLIVADAPLARYGTEPIERGLRDLDWVSRCAVGHETVVERLRRAGPVVPMKLFTLFSSDARAVEDVARRRKAIDRLFDRVAGCQELGVRLVLDERRAVRNALRRGAPPARADRAATGAAFLLRKKIQHDATRRLAVVARFEATRVFDALARHARSARRQETVAVDGARRVVLDAAFLVPDARIAKFRATARDLAGSLGEGGFAVTVTGPWPPYNFVSDLPRARRERA